MRTLRMLSGLVARVLRRADKTPSGPRRETGIGWRTAKALADARDANEAVAIAHATAAKSIAAFGDAANSAMTTLGDCYHDGVAYSLAYDANGEVELCGETFTNLDSGVDGGAKAALRRHRQNFDPTRDVPRFIVALRPVKVEGWRSSDDTKAYGLPPGPLAGTPLTAEVWGEHVAKGSVEALRRAMERVKQDCDRRGIDISKSTVTVSVKPHDGQEAFARCEKVDRLTHFTTIPFTFGGLVADGEPCEHPGCLDHTSHPCETCGRIAGMPVKACDECCCPHCECDGTCDPDYATSCHRCDTWVCAYCVVEGACHNCFSKMQGGVN